jgi:hypothetical protein
VTKLHRARLAGSLLLLTAIVSSPGAAFAISHEQALENCRATVGRPTVQGCMRRTGGGSENFEKCRATAFPIVRKCIIDAMGRPTDIDDRSPAKKSSAGKNGARSKSALRSVATRGVVSDVAPLPSDESRMSVDLKDVEGAIISTKTSYENTFQTTDGRVFVSHVTDALDIRIISTDTIEVHRDNQVFDENDKPRGPTQSGSRTFQLGKEQSVRGNDVVWKFEDSTLLSMASLVEGGFRAVVPVFKQNNVLKCVVMSGFAREDGRGPIKTTGATGALIEILSSRKIASSCEVKK